jgi:hypothetical protein
MAWLQQRSGGGEPTACRYIDVGSGYSVAHLNAIVTFAARPLPRLRELFVKKAPGFADITHVCDCWSTFQVDVDWEVDVDSGLGYFKSRASLRPGVA